MEFFFQKRFNGLDMISLAVLLMLGCNGYLLLGLILFVFGLAFSADGTNNYYK